ncbi:uncharacterized protein LOC108673650 [Hyalella azteca]|uniref:Uncharacterized protein LOC108673650 n=1 Tax=Hyalella azteca TaxID=294128 RepID=A0A8B7NVP2_HYAAZ|nr:uncharacterized protein LOC108673650 [Hyalella azteca]
MYQKRIIKSCPLKLLAVITFMALAYTAISYIHQDSAASPDDLEDDYAYSWQSSQEKIGVLERRLTRASKSLERLWCATRDVMSNGGFCVTADRIYTGGNIIFEPELCYFVEELVGNASVADFGAGLGKYGMCLLRKNQTNFQLSEKQKKEYIADMQATLQSIKKTPKVVYSWHGFDGGIAIEEVSGGFISHADLSEEGLWLGRKWDWVMSIEVGEHIPRNSEDYFLDNLARHACQGIQRVLVSVTY